MALTAWSIAYVTIPILIRFLKKKQIMDVPGDRASHDKPTPTLGGIGIFMGVVITLVFWFLPSMGGKTIGVGIGGIILFGTGIVDDIIDIPASRKLLLQILAAVVVAFVGIRFRSLYGFFGIYEINVVLQYIVTIVVIVGVINAFNLLDGINGLAGGIGLISFFFLGSALKAGEHDEMPVLAFTIAGAILAFLHYNFRRKAAIFMGDTGSLILGFVLVVLGVEVFNMAGEPHLLTGNLLPNPQVLAFAVLFLPVIDALRVFATRMISGKSPLDPDKTHIHHVLLEAGCSHVSASLLLWLIHILLIFCALLLGNWPEIAVIVLLIIGVLLPKMLMLSVPFLRGQKHSVYRRLRLSNVAK